MIEQNPNSYYYRFNAPGEIQQKGQWAPDERKRFFDRLEEVGANGQWGLFAMTIPGRVGYQVGIDPQIRIWILAYLLVFVWKKTVLQLL
jgi:hypothetical protein